MEWLIVFPILVLSLVLVSKSLVGLWINSTLHHECQNTLRTLILNYENIERPLMGCGVLKSQLNQALLKNLKVQSCRLINTFQKPEFEGQVKIPLLGTIHFECTYPKPNTAQKESSVW